MNYGTDFKSLRNEVSPEEWQTRVELAACYRLVDTYGMTDLIYNHITAKIPNTEFLLINLYGLLYKEITASSLVKIDLDGNIISKPDTDYGINRSGYVIHGAIHQAREDVCCVIHTHTPSGMAVSSMKCGLLPMTQTSMRFVGHLGYHDFEGPAIDLDERVRLVHDLGMHDAMVLRVGQLFNRHSIRCTNWNCHAALRLKPWHRALKYPFLCKIFLSALHIFISLDLVVHMACWNGQP